jgi:hypothetical protein
LLNKTKGRTQAGASSSDDYSIEGMVDDSVFLEESVLSGFDITYASLERCWLATTEKPYREGAISL